MVFAALVCLGACVDPNLALLQEQQQISNIPHIQQITPKPEWAQYAKDLQVCLKAPAPITPYASITWYRIPDGATIDTKGLWAGSSYLHAQAIVIDSDNPWMVRHELTHTLWHVSALLLGDKEYHPKRWFNMRCQNKIGT